MELASVSISLHRQIICTITIITVELYRWDYREVNAKRTIIHLSWVQKGCHGNIYKAHY